VHDLKQTFGLHGVPPGHDPAVHCAHCGGGDGAAGCVQFPTATKHKSSVHTLPSLHRAACSAAVSGTFWHAPAVHWLFWQVLLGAGQVAVCCTHDPVVGVTALFVHWYDRQKSPAGQTLALGPT